MRPTPSLEIQMPIRTLPDAARAALPSIHSLCGELFKELGRDASRGSFFHTLSRLLQQRFSFDRLCINLYDPNSELLSVFSAAEGTVVNSLSPVRKAGKTTVAGHVISSRKPVVITDIAQHFAESMLHPMAEAGLTTTMAFPLLLNEKILGTLHCSFIKKPDNLYAIMEMFLELCPYVAISLGAVLATEGMEQGFSFSPRQPDEQEQGCDDYIFVGQTMRAFMQRVNAVAKLDVPVLLLGETGTGKTHIAKYIHCHSKRRTQRFVKVHCPALAATLFESELFGHVKGSFTGAGAKRVGRFELAHQGTLFLDEIAELSQEMQSKLLHVLEERSFERVGESMSLPVDARLVAATNVRVVEAVRSGRLRSDFYHRLAACSLELPALRQRIEDLPVLAEFFNKRLAARYSLPPLRLEPDHIQRLQRHPWPGNVRELRNAVNGLLLQNWIAGRLTMADVEQVLHAAALTCEEDAPTGAPSAPADLASVPARVPGETNGASLEEMERRHIEQALARTRGLVSGPRGAATLLGLPRTTLQHRMRKLGISARKS